ncbi:MAG: SAP domain-containing protein, partial [Candidatus Thermoplasmatota archaeon]|nr:SAP domain-containing protein [Candidatus Thermoplasmatota archaeon]
MSDEVSLESLTVNQLKAMLGERGLSKSGKKADLIERLNATKEEKTIELGSSIWTRNVVGQFNLAQTV